MLLDDQSQPANARTLYERLITAEKVDLLMGPYGTSAIIAAMGVAQRFSKLFIQSSLGDPSLAPYEMQFPALPLGRRPAHRRHRGRARCLCEPAVPAEDDRLRHQQVPVGAGPRQGRPGGRGEARL